MAFRFSEQHITDYYHHGYTVFQGILPPSLIGDLRRASDCVRALARQNRGPQAQRLQPLGKFEGELELKPFKDYAELPELNDACQKVLTPAHRVSGLPDMAVLIEPAEKPWCTSWHRDITENSNGVDPEEFRRITLDPTFFTQVNCALYTDTCTWYVPSSDGRKNIPGEAEASKKKPNLEGKTAEEAERLCLEYCQCMPGAIQLVLEPGDFALYRPNGWHIGNYAPYRKRATLHDGVWKPETREWYKRWFEAIRKNEEAAKQSGTEKASAPAKML